MGGGRERAGSRFFWYSSLFFGGVGRHVVNEVTMK